MKENEILNGPNIQRWSKILTSPRGAKSPTGLLIQDHRLQWWRWYNFHFHNGLLDASWVAKTPNHSCDLLLPEQFDTRGSQVQTAEWTSFLFFTTTTCFALPLSAIFCPAHFHSALPQWYCASVPTRFCKIKVLFLQTTTVFVTLHTDWLVPQRNRSTLDLKALLRYEVFEVLK